MIVLLGTFFTPNLIIAQCLDFDDYLHLIGEVAMPDGAFDVATRDNYAPVSSQEYREAP